MTRRYLVMWDQLGLESLVDLTELEQAAVWAELKGEPKPQVPNLEYMKLRARYNAQRHYEIYLFEAEDTITEAVLREQFEESPQTIVDLIREQGEQLYSDREHTEEKRIV